MRTIRLKVVATGVGKDARLIDTNTGEEIRFAGTESIEWRQDRGPNKLTIRVLDFELQAEGFLHEPEPKAHDITAGEERANLAEGPKHEG